MKKQSPYKVEVFDVDFNEWLIDPELNGLLATRNNSVFAAYWRTSAGRAIIQGLVDHEVYLAAYHRRYG